MAGDRVGNITPSGEITEFDIPTANAIAGGITAGPDGNVWFTEYATRKVASISPSSGTVTEFLLPGGTLGSAFKDSVPVPFLNTLGPDGNVWFTEQSTDRVGSITPAGAITAFNIPTTNALAYGIASGPDGNVWFTERAGNKIAKVTTAGVFTEFAVPTSNALPYGITAGPDGNIWFTEGVVGKIGKVTTGGVFTEFPIPIANALPVKITAGADGNLWFVDEASDAIGRITTAGTITEFPIPTAGALPYGITTGPDGNVWFTEEAGNNIGQITPSGVITEFAIPTANASPVHITVGPDGALWFTERDQSKTGRITTAGSTTEFPLPTSNVLPEGITTGSDGNLWLNEYGGSQVGQSSTSGTVAQFSIPINFSVSAYGADVNQGPPDAASSLPCTPNPGTVSNIVGSELLPLGLGTIGALSSSDTGTANDLAGTQSAQAQASVSTVSLLGGLIAADGISVTATASGPDGPPVTATGQVTFTNLTVLGISIAATVSPNTVISLPLIGSVTLNQQVSRPNGISVNALNVSASGTSLVVGHAEAYLVSPSANCPAQ
jgi:streptogramin lyase